MAYTEGVELIVYACYVFYRDSGEGLFDIRVSAFRQEKAFEFPGIRAHFPEDRHEGQEALVYVEIL